MRSALARLADAALALLRTRGELAAVEFAESKRAAADALGLTLARRACSAGVRAGRRRRWVVVYFWDSGRLTAIAVVTLVYALLAFGLWRVDSARNDAAARAVRRARSPSSRRTASGSRGRRDRGRRRSR